MQSSNIKKIAHKLIDQLPDDSTWNDAIYEMVVRREIDLGLADSEAGRTTRVDDVRNGLVITSQFCIPASVRLRPFLNHKSSK
ncbi:MAG: hypothetical protein COB30_000785 [Ectothiorhodospiraceae bacterium]|nr:hypothetical protein [Ectothiorhodospiraceae bacterium]